MVMFFSGDTKRLKEAREDFKKKTTSGGGLEIVSGILLYCHNLL
jgi:hypothetical protein